jgi:hypothetical protein
VVRSTRTTTQDPWSATNIDRLVQAKRPPSAVFSRLARKLKLFLRGISSRALEQADDGWVPWVVCGRRQGMSRRARSNVVPILDDGTKLLDFHTTDDV